VATDRFLQLRAATFGESYFARYVLTLEGKREPEEQQRDLPPGISTAEMPRPI
jgi:hypothetical protein